MRVTNEIKILDEKVMRIDVGSGWTITDIWFDPDVPVDEIDCIKVKFERTKSDHNRPCDNCKDWICEWCTYGQPNDEPQTDPEIAKAIVHKMIDDAVIAEDAYPDLRQKMHDAVDEYEPQIVEQAKADLEKRSSWSKTYEAMCKDEPQTEREGE